VTVTDQTSSQGYVLDGVIDLRNMASGDTVEIRVYVMAISGGTLSRAYYQRFVNVQDDVTNYKSPLVYIPAMTATTEWKLTLKQTAGTARNFDWAVYSG
jgi:acetyl-CoA carboxylase carboxyltransferase component